RADDGVVRYFGIGEVLADRAPGHGHRVQVQEARSAAQLLQDGVDPAGAVYVLDVDAWLGGRHLADARRAPRDLVDAFERVAQAGFARDRQRVQDGVGAA